jgi:hypothetical protein
MVNLVGSWIILKINGVIFRLFELDLQSRHTCGFHFHWRPYRISASPLNTNIKPTNIKPTTLHSYILTHCPSLISLSNHRAAAPRAMAFHASAPRDEEAKETAPVESKGGLFGTGLSEWFALPIGITAAVPILKMDLYVVNEETQLAAVFVAFCVAFWTQGGDAVHNALDERAKTLLKDHNEAEDKVIAALEQKLDFLKANQNMVNDFEAINEIREASYAKLNAAGAIKPQHDFKMQMERVLNMIAQEEASATEKTKMAIMAEATAHVTQQFTTSKDLKKAALDAAIAQIKGTAKEGTVNPVRAQFSMFLKEKADAASKIVGNEEEQAQRAAMIAKMSAIAKTEKMFFDFDASGKPMMKA